MACSEWKERLVGQLYGEIDGPDLDRLKRHLEGCAGCRQELNDMESMRRELAGAAPAVPEPPRVIVLGQPAVTPERWWSRAGSVRMFAAGFLAATVLLAAGLAAGLALSPGADSGAGGQDRTEVAGNLMDRNHLQEILDARDARIIKLIDHSSGQVQNSLAEYSSALEARRKEDLRLVLGELITTEMWTGKAIHENRESLRHLALASQPGVTQW